MKLSNGIKLYFFHYVQTMKKSTKESAEEMLLLSTKAFSSLTANSLTVCSAVNS